MITDQSEAVRFMQWHRRMRARLITGMTAAGALVAAALLVGWLS